MGVINHRDRPLQVFPEEPWRIPIRYAINRSAGAETLSVWTHSFNGRRRAPLHYHDIEEVLLFVDVEGDGGWVRLDDEEFPILSDMSVLVPPGTHHCFGMRGPGRMRSISILADADAVLGHRIYEVGTEPCDLPPPPSRP
jgi:mannose-6-phosphate isomerase-like protein (cupin superfamily)